MCFYCGCRDTPLIKQFIAEHEVTLELAVAAAEALRDGAVLRARGRLDVMARQLEAHWRGEEEGLFAAMRDDPQYAAYLDELVTDHDRLRALLGEADPAIALDRARLLAAFDDLRLHIAKEEDGLFPASLTALSGDQWDASMAAWRRAHPDDPSLDDDLSRRGAGSLGDDPDHRGDPPFGEDLDHRGDPPLGDDPDHRGDPPLGDDLGRRGAGSRGDGLDRPAPTRATS